MYWVLLSCVSLYSECVEHGWWIVYLFQWSEHRKLGKGERNWLAELTVALLVSFIIVKNSLFCQRSSACLARWIPSGKPGNHVLCAWWVSSCGWLVSGPLLLWNTCFEKLETREWYIGCSSSGDTLLSAVFHMSVGVSYLIGEGKQIEPRGLYRPGTENVHSCFSTCQSVSPLLVPHPCCIKTSSY